VGEEGADLSTFDFASDEKPTKKTARLMLQNLNDINAKLASVGSLRQWEHRSTNGPPRGTYFFSNLLVLGREPGCEKFGAFNGNDTAHSVMP
jgi:hypothetical protein